jgi:hypothetical protein
MVCDVMDALRPDGPRVSAASARVLLLQLECERAAAASARDEELAAELSADVDACRDAFIGLAVMEIASFRAQLSGPQLG